MRPHRKRLSIDIPTELAESIARIAKKKNITVTRWVMRACYRKLFEERSDEEQ